MRTKKYKKTNSRQKVIKIVTQCVKIKTVVIINSIVEWTVDEKMDQKTVLKAFLISKFNDKKKMFCNFSVTVVLSSLPFFDFKPFFFCRTLEEMNIFWQKMNKFIVVNKNKKINIRKNTLCIDFILTLYLKFLFSFD